MLIVPDSFGATRARQLLREGKGGNDCHNPKGSPEGGRFCSKGGSSNKGSSGASAKPNKDDLPTFRVRGRLVNYGPREGQIGQVMIDAHVKSREEANRIRDLFPKSYQVKAMDLYSSGETKGYVEVTADFRNARVQGNMNEAGIKRLQKFLDRVNYTVVLDEQDWDAAKPDLVKKFLGLD
jgi:hypothetical protein